MKRIWAAATVVALGAVGTAVTSAQAAPPRDTPRYVPAPVAWRPCTEMSLKAQGAECGTVTVPMDYANPDGTKIELALARVRHSTPDDRYQGAILVNPGGPGGAGRVMATLGSHVPKQAGNAYDWIGFDPRGVGASQPKLTCDSDYTGYNRPAYVPVTPELEKAWHARTKKYAEDCARAGGALLRHMRTEDSVRDIDSIRQALGQEKISFYGFSYGTYLGQVYATRFPERVRRMVLDGNVNPRRVWYRSNLDQDIAFDRNIKIYFRWLADHDATFHLGATGKAVERLYYQQLDELAGKPAGGVIGPAELTDIFLQPGYYVFGWQQVGQAFSDWITKKDPAGLKKLYDDNNPQTPGSDNNYAVYLAVQCTDAPWPAKWETWAEDNWRVYRKAPFETWGNAWYNAPCRHWAAPAKAPVEVNGAKAPPILLISETLDAATPYSGTLLVRRLFPRAALVEGVNGTTHAGSLFGNPCVDETIADYLATGALPKRVAADRSDKQCKPISPPEPGQPGLTRSAEPLDRLRLQRLITGR
ncbi:alpha/beta hydrolase [Actinoplanes teichomyceticus]|uniref:Alpha/beta hydrolase family protein n=1 Tax=Actinoplanes teichomyceticus TaxID=1867 RepID=A0A561WSL9_ACTTI|nr:alpha/beta hydrolase [Actinoplanes teichomyceticus]TWG26857.1 alpha/beta hydrolase family protein [Actinoplanes teichomyceticus]GIF15257.1 peptidase [Actinoplanes teichomyceticus]